jgi:uncharacterized protein YkwD
MSLRRAITRGMLLAVVALATVLFVSASTAEASTPTARSNAAPTTDTSGYAWVGYFRGLAGLGGVARNPTLEAQEAVHVRYLADHTLSCETNVHDELTSRVAGCGANPAATAAGKAAANNSNITRVSASVPDRTAVSNWFSAAFHALTLLDPRLNSTGYAAYYTGAPKGAGPLPWKFTAGVDVYRGRGARYTGITVAFPATYAATPLLSYTVGTESPEPFRTTAASSPCRSWGSKAVVSSPVIMQWPLAAAVNAGSGSIVDLTTGRAQPTCSLTAGSYPAGSLPRQFLGGVNGITKSAFYYAASPFVAGHRYQLRVGGVATTTFTATQLPTAPVLSVSTLGRSATPAWRDTAVGVINHGLQLWSGAGCTGTLLAYWRLTATRMTIQGLLLGQVYSVRVSSDKADGGGRWSGCVNFRPA